MTLFRAKVTETRSDYREKGRRLLRTKGATAIDPEIDLNQVVSE